MNAVQMKLVLAALLFNGWLPPQVREIDVEMVMRRRCLRRALLGTALLGTALPVQFHYILPHPFVSL